MVVARRILSPLLVLLGFCLVAAGLYRSFITFSANVDWPIVAIGTVVLVAGLLVEAAPLHRRVIGSAVALLALLLFAFGYPLYGMSGLGMTAFFSLLWIPAVALGAAALFIARGRSWWTVLLAIPVVIVYVVIGVLVGFGPIGWWPVNVRLPGPLMEWLAMSGIGFWVVQVALIAVLVALTALAAAGIDRLIRARRTVGAPADGTMVR